jgi:hypothetical protein
MAVKYTNNAASTIASAINSSVTTINLATGDGAEFPTLTTGDHFFGSLIGSSTSEIVKVTARSSDTLTVVRGQDNTSAASWDAGTKFELRVCAALLKAVSGTAPVTLTGAIGNLYINQSVALTITNFNVFSTYSVAVSAGSVSRSGDSITVTAPATSGTLTLTVTMDGNAYPFTLTVQAAGIATPTNTSPSNGAYLSSTSPTLTASAFSWIGASDTHASSDWQLATDSGFTTIVASVTASTTNKTTWTPTGLSLTQTYYWRVRYNGTTNGTSAFSTAFSISPSSVATPTHSTPANAATNQGKNPTLTASAFATVGASDTHASSDWQLATDSGFVTVVQSQTASTSNKTSWTVADLTVSTTYYWRVRYNGTATGTSQWSTATSFTTAASFGPTTIGEAFGGGFYAGKINDGGTQYYLIVAPKSSGENSSRQWKTANTSTSGTTSVIAGPTNSANMNNASHPAAQFCEGLTIGGFSDWYMPAKNELEVLYYFLKPTTDANNTSSGSNANAVSPQPINTNYTSGAPAQTSATAFRSGGAEAFAAGLYWSSTEASATNAWVQNFVSGRQVNDNKDGSYYVRAVRRLAI